MAIMPKKQVEDSKKKRATRKSRKTAVSASSGTKKSARKKVVAPIAKASAPVTALMVLKGKKVVRRSAMAEMQQRASEVVSERPQGGSGADRTGAMQALMSYGMVLGAFVGAVIVGAFVIRVSNAATFQGPTQVAPGGNIPVTIWNAQSTGAKQLNADIDIAGIISAGDVGLDLGAGSGGQNLIYGFAPYATTHDGDRLLLLETEASGVWTSRFAVSKDGDMFAMGRVGVGTSTPSTITKLHVFESANSNLPQVIIQNNDTGVNADASLRFNQGVNNYVIGLDATDNSFRIADANVLGSNDRLVIGSNGNIGIGTDSPGFPLSVSSGAGTAVIGADDTNVGTRLYTGIRMARSGTEQWFLGMNETDDDLQIRATVSGTGTDVMTINKSGDVRAAGSITAEGCFGASFVGVTTTSFPVSALTSYYGINNKCGLDYPGSHACTVNEMLESIRCSEGSSPIRTSGGEIAWINGGPPGFTANSNDCIGWTDSTASAYGRYWSFDNVTGGFGTMTTCNAPGLKVACCS